MVHWVVAFLLLLASVAFLLPLSGDDNPKADALLKQLRARLGDPKADREKLRQDLLSFRRTYFGSTQAVQAAEMVMQLPSPQDKLDPKRIPALDRFDWQPKELVAVLGEHRGRHGAAVGAVLVTPDGKTVISAGGSLLRFFDATTLRQKAIAGHPSVTAMAMTKDGKTLATTGADGAVRVWDISEETPKTTVTIPAATAPLYAVAITPNGKTVAAGGVDSLVRIWDLPLGNDKKEKLSLGGNGKPVTALAFSPDGKVIVSGQDETVGGWDLSAGEQPKELFKLDGHSKGVSSVAYSPDGKMLAAATADNMIKLWNMTGARPGERPVLKPATGSIGSTYCVAFSPNGRTLASAGSDYKAHLWDVGTTPRERAALEGHISTVTGVAFSPKGDDLFSGSSDCTVRMWDVGVGKPRQHWEPKGHLSHVYNAVFTPDGQTLATGGMDSTLRLWSVAATEGKERSLLKGAGIMVGLSLAPDGKTLAVGTNTATVQIFDAVAGRELRQLTGNPGASYYVAYAPDASLRLAVSGGKEVVLWDSTRKEEIRRLEGFTTPAGMVAFSPDGKKVMAGGGSIEYDKAGRPLIFDGKYRYIDCVLRIWDAETGKEEHAVKSYTMPVSGLTFTPDGKTVLSGTSDEKLRQLDLTAMPPKEAEPVIKGASGAIRSVVCSPDGKLTATLGPDATLVLWETATGKRLKQWNFAENVGGVAFAPDGRHLAVTLALGPVYILRLSGPTGQN